LEPVPVGSAAVGAAVVVEAAVEVVEVVAAVAGLPYQLAVLESGHRDCELDSKPVTKGLMDLQCWPVQSRPGHLPRPLQDDDFAEGLVSGNLGVQCLLQR